VGQTTLRWEPRGTICFRRFEGLLPEQITRRSSEISRFRIAQQDIEQNQNTTICVTFLRAKIYFHIHTIILSILFLLLGRFGMYNYSVKGCNPTPEWNSTLWHCGLQWVAVRFSEMWWAAVCCSVLQQCCSVLQWDDLGRGCLLLLLFPMLLCAVKHTTSQNLWPKIQGTGTPY